MQDMNSNAFDDEFAVDSNMSSSRRPPAGVPVYGGPPQRSGVMGSSTGQLYRDNVPQQNQFDQPPRAVRPSNTARPLYANAPVYGGPPQNDMRQRGGSFHNDDAQSPPRDFHSSNQSLRGQPRQDYRDFGSSRGPPPNAYVATNRYEFGRMNQDNNVLQNRIQERSGRPGYPPQNDRPWQNSQPPFNQRRSPYEQQPSNDVQMNNGMNGRSQSNDVRNIPSGPTFGGPNFQENNERNLGRQYSESNNFQNDYPPRNGRQYPEQNYDQKGYPPQRQGGYRQVQDQFVNNGGLRDDFGSNHQGYPFQQNGGARNYPNERNMYQNSFPQKQRFDNSERYQNNGSLTRDDYGVTGRGGMTVRGSFTNGSGSTRGGSTLASRDSPQVSRYEESYSSQRTNANGNEDKHRAPRDFKPEDRNVQDILRYDRDIANRDGNMIDEDADITVEGVGDILVCQNWSDMELHPVVEANIKKTGYIRPRKVQQYTIPVIKDGYDCQVQCETGTGKSAAFLIPIVDMCAKMLDKGEKFSMCAPMALIISPTRELCNQLYEQSKKFSEGTRVQVVRAFGEYNVWDNKQQIKKGCHIICACLGRLLQFMREGFVDPHLLKFLVIDEADRLISDVHNEEILELLHFPDLNEKRQTMLFSATLDDPTVAILVDKAFKLEKRVTIRANAKSNSRLIYEVHLIPDENAKHEAIVKYIRKISKNGHVPRVLIFVNKKVDTDRVAIRLTQANFNSTTIHGDRGQDLRQEAMNSFKSGKTPILVATDVCARGVDIKDLDYVINFDLPKEPSTFVQRCGRTGRTHRGTAVSFFHLIDDALFKGHLAETIIDAGQICPSFLLDDFNVEPEYPVMGDEDEENDRSDQENNYLVDFPQENGFHDESPQENGFRQESSRENDLPQVIKDLDSLGLDGLENAAVTQTVEMIVDNNADHGWD